jgi:glycosyltransferase involved in cell wall biosynthesis
MRIFHVTPMYFPVFGGCELHIQKLSEGLALRGHDVTVLTANVGSIRELANSIYGGLPDEELIGAVKVRRFRPDGGVLGSVLKNWYRHVRGGCRSLTLLLGKEGTDFFLESPALVQLIPHLVPTRMDIIGTVNWNYPPAYHTYLASKLKKFILVGIPLFHTAETWCARPIYKKMLANCDAVIVNTACEANFVRKQAATRVEVFGVGIEPSVFEHRDGRAIRARYGLGNHPVVGFVGRLDFNKGAILLLQAMRKVWEWNREVRLVCAGPRAGRRTGVETFIAGFTEFERERIVMIDDFPEKDKASIFDSFDVFVLPSIGESFGIAYLEAWMCRKPVIGARIGPTQCVIDEGTDGLLVDPTDPQDTAQSIIDLLSDSEKRERMGRSGHAKTVAQFTWDKVTDKVEKLYLELLAAKGAGGLSRG